MSDKELIPKTNKKMMMKKGKKATTSMEGGNGPQTKLIEHKSFSTVSISKQSFFFETNIL